VTLPARLYQRWRRGKKETKEFGLGDKIILMEGKLKHGNLIVFR
jgi:hypothetical protein